ncbi:Sjogren's syndrome/scleroderma autoantigen 1 family protein [Halosolutus gelatinilyticus]|uniref:Sjogren's syndrome/scleroderma autoantigen 1 family protein n=1 Tax=Halosolutus gelatinilyticus TaxID=2931975 RepID=UPI001FF67411|nr:Sjogren's syndrome/scleroderma autoantigen 1 family protein [Halosolutus gelatinilyticus]
MSDFDKEAEREKLRKKYERDKADREATQRMSDLLLKGATMTNMHCGTCGDPLFQENETTFCPSCHGTAEAVEGTDLEARPAEGSIDEDTPSDDAAAEDAADGDRTAAEADARADESTTDDRSETPTQAGSSLSSESVSEPDSDARTGAGDPDEDSIASSSRTVPDREPETSTDRRDSAVRSRTSAIDEPSRPSTSTARSRNADLDGARKSLVAALEKFAAEAAETDDPRYAKECLEAAREAGEALLTLR